MRKFVFVLGILAIIAVTLLYGFRSDTGVIVTTVNVERGDMESIIRVTGHVINDRTVTLTALLDGQVQGMLVQKGESVKLGQVLAHLDKREADAELGKARAELARERELVVQLTRKLKRLNKVSSMGGESRQVVDDVESALSAAKAQMRVAKADLHIAEIHREKVDITAPFDGVITDKATEVGQWVEAGTKLLTLVANDGRVIEANVDAADSGLVAADQSVQISCDAFPGKDWTESVQWIAPALTEDDKETANTFAVRMSLGTEAPPLLLGQQVDVSISLMQRENVLKLPYGAILDTEDGGHQIALAKEGYIHLVPVEIGIENLTHVEITADIEANDVVVLPEGKSLQEGDAIQIKSRAAH